jgi:hypothetical protein
VAEIYQNAGGEKMVINAVREAVLQAFEATDWLDLRAGFFLSIEKSSGAHDTISGPGIVEEIGTPPRPFLQWTDRVAIGLTDSHTGSVFFGYTNAFRGRPEISVGTSKLVSSDLGIGTSNSDYWRPTNELGDQYTLQIIQSGISRAVAADGSQPHFVQNFAGGHAAGYATALGLRLTRQDARGRAKIITMQVKKTVGGHSSDLVFSSTPDIPTLDGVLEAFPTTVQTLGPVEVNHVPDMFFLYWPFRNTRLRIHSMGIVKAS